MIIVVVGRAGSGKTVAAKEICKLTGFPLVEASDVVRSITKGRKRQEMNLKKYELEDKDPDWLWRVMREEILRGRDHARSCVVSGIREPYLLHKILTDEWLKQFDIHVLGVEATPFTRYARLCVRDGFMSVEDFRNTDDGTLERNNFVGDNTLGIDIVLTRCDKVFDANGKLEDLTKDIQSYLFSKGVLGKSRKEHKTW